ncbi:hypothetical protein CIK05_11320 [Bdellovibrio sp. qaytius]|nr:hypothetical protein CIK05_11320 [Bdellovibrio sp. qaytius]
MALVSSHLEAFLAVSQTLNFTKAADVLHITQSALSQRIINLEEELATTLFIRDRSGLKLTETAVKLLHYCKIKNNLEDEFIHSLKSQNSNELAGLVRIGGFSSVMASLVVPALVPLAKDHAKVKIQTFTREVDDLFAMLTRGEIDYMLLDDRFEKENLERILLGHEVNFLVQNPRCKNEDVYLDHDEKDQVTLAYFKKYKIKPEKFERHYLDDVYGLISGVKAGLGRAILPRHLIKGQKDIVNVGTKNSLDIPVYLYYYARPYYTKLHHRIVEDLKKIVF